MTDEERFFYNHGYKQAERDFIKELEKIKAEIKGLAFLFDDLSPDKELVVDLDNIEEVFNKHISELKGESEKENKQGVLEQIAEEQKTLSDTTKAWSDYIKKHGDIY